MPRDKPTIAIATGDPAGIGPEISLKAALDAAVRQACNPIVVSDPGVQNYRFAAPLDSTLSNPGALST